MGSRAEQTTRKKANWPGRIILGAAALLVLVIACFASAAVLPAWWADIIRGQVQGNPGAGIPVGMFYGFVFTFVPLLVAWQATRKGLAWPWKLLIVVTAVAFAAPNLLTAGIMFGNSPAARNGQRILGTDAPGFPLWTQISAIAAVVAFLAGLVLWRIWRQRGRQVKALKKADAERSLAATAANGPSPAPDASAAPAEGNSRQDNR